MPRVVIDEDLEYQKRINESVVRLPPKSKWTEPFPLVPFTIRQPQRQPQRPGPVVIPWWKQHCSISGCFLRVGHRPFVHRKGGDTRSRGSKQGHCYRFVRTDGREVRLPPYCSFHWLQVCTRRCPICDRIKIFHWRYPCCHQCYVPPTH